MAGALALASCGGGDGGSGVGGGVTPAATPVGVYSGTTGTEKALVVLRQGNFWLFHGPMGGSALPGGVATGANFASEGAFASNDVADISSELPGIARGVMNATVVPQATLAGTLTLSNRSYSFSSAFVAGSTTPSTVATVAGVYRGGAIVAGGPYEDGAWDAVISIAEGGYVSGTTLNGCELVGDLVPDRGLATYSLGVNFGGPPCPPTHELLRGVAVLEGTRLWAAAFSTDRVVGLAFSGLLLQ